MSDPALLTSGLSKSYPVGHLRPRPKPALVSLDLRVERGEIFGYLGPNGSGKTTTLKVILGLVRPDAGTGSVFGLPLNDRGWKYRAGYLPEQPYFYDYLTAREYVEYAARLCGLGRRELQDRARETLQRVGLERSRDVALRRFSKGMLQRLGLAQALVNDPDILFLDEPMSGLDPLGRRFVRELILELRSQGKTIFFSTHVLPDAEAMCDRVAVLRDGRLVNVGRLDEILQLDVTHFEVLGSGGDEQALGRPPSGIGPPRTLGERWRVETPEAQLLTVLEWARSTGARILSVQPVRQSLEDYFFKELGPGAGGPEWEQA